MSDTNPTATTETPGTTAAPVTQPTSPAITPEIQAMIDAARAEGRNSGAADARRALEGKVKPAATHTPAPAPVTTPTPAPAGDDLTRLRAFDRALGKFDVPDAAIERLEREFRASGASDAATWVSDTAAVFGFKPRGATATPTTVTTNPAATVTPQPLPPPVTGGGPPPAPSPVRSDIPIQKMSLADRSALVRQIGPIEYSKRLLAESATTVVDLGRRRT